MSPAETSRPVTKGCNHPGATSVRDLRNAAGLSLRELEDLTGINRGVWSQIETGRMLPEPEHLGALSRVLEVPIEEWRIRFVLERKPA